MCEEIGRGTQGVTNFVQQIMPIEADQSGHHAIEEADSKYWWLHRGVKGKRARVWRERQRKRVGEGEKEREKYQKYLIWSRRPLSFAPPPYSHSELAVKEHAPTIDPVMIPYRFTGGNFAAKVMRGGGQRHSWMMNEFEMMNVLHHPRLIREEGGGGRSG